MSPYLADETSVQFSRPIELFEFAVGSTTYYYTSYEYDITYASNVYLAAPVRRSAINVATSGDHPAITVEIGVDTGLGQTLATGLPPQLATGLIRRQQSDETVIVWQGSLTAVTLTGRVVRVKIGALVDDPVTTKIPGALVLRMCNHVLYKGRCFANPNDFDHLTSVTGSGLRITVADVGTFPDDYFKAGTIRVGIEERTILKQTGTTLDLLAPFNGNLSSTPCTLFAGCDHTVVTCDEKFAQLHNYGGLPYLPASSPFVDVLVNKPD